MSTADIHMRGCRCGQVSGHDAVLILLVTHRFIYSEIILMYMIDFVSRVDYRRKVGSCDLTREQ